MLASLLRAFLCAELLLCVSIAGALLAAGWNLSGALAATLVLDAFTRTAITLGAFNASSVLGPAGAAAQLSFAARLRLVAAEIWWTAVAFSVLMPFPRLAGSSDAGPPRDGTPVLLVHGYLCNRGIWRRTKSHLEARGISVWTHDAEPLFAGIDHYVAALAERIEGILAATGATKLVIVGHSMGGLLLRAYLRAHGAGRVALGITLGTPHHGTAIALRGFGANARQMAPGSGWLRELARAEPGAPAAPLVSIWSRHDNVVVPQESARLEGAENIALEGIGHVTLAFSGPVQALILEKIRAAAAPAR
ncbi:MAG: alpha/beta fold hydrolase [Betaproteobacteria bacterium]|nr:alpha/beta fold hydrolase [Betaproteobacteria bacterium]